MAHSLGSVPPSNFKKGDRVQHTIAGTFGTVYQDQTDPLLVHICWDSLPSEVVCYKADAVRIAPWHEVNVKDYIKDDNPWRPLGTVADEGLVEEKPEDL